MPQVPNKTTITQINLGDPVSPAIANAPHSNLETNIDNILSYLKTNASGNFEQDSATTTGLDFGYRAGIIRQRNTINVVTAGVVTMAASDINYVEITASGVISSNIIGFTDGSIPLHQVTTDATTIVDVVDKRTMLVSTNGNDIKFTPTSSIASTDVESAISEAENNAINAGIAFSVVFGS